MNYSQSQLDSRLRYNENIKSHYNLDNLEEIVSKMSDERRIYVSNLLYEKHYIRLNRILINLGLKQLNK